MTFDTGIRVIPALIGAAAGQTAFILAQAVELPRETPWTPALVTALFGGVIGLLGAVASMIVMLRNAKNDRSKATSQVQEVKSIVDGGRLELLREIERLTQRVADLSNRKGDAEAASAASENADAQNVATTGAAAVRKATDA